MEAKKGRREMKKFELTTEFITNAFGKKLFRIKALVEFGDVKAGELGGYVEKEGNVSQDDNAWVSGDAEVFGNAKVSGNAKVFGNAKVYDNAWVSGDARVYDNAWVFGDARVSGDAWVSDNAWVSGDARVSGDADYALVQGFGTEFRCTTFYRGKNKKIMVNCGCFHGDLEGFRKQVKETRNGKIAKEYLMIADLMEYHFTSEDSSNE
jgi:predicted acyltransferase (DUF342 family)